jgi:hypothetical protein
MVIDFQYTNLRGLKYSEHRNRSVSKEETLITNILREMHIKTTMSYYLTHFSVSTIKNLQGKNC